VYIALVGGDEFRVGCETMDREILDVTGSAIPTVLVIPTAAAHQNPSKAATHGCCYFSKLGAQASALMVLGVEQASDPEFLEPVDSADVLYFTGGSPAYLLDVLKGSLLLEKLKVTLARGAIVVGSSAGAMVLGSRMLFRNWTDGLGIVQGLAVLPHHERSNPSAISNYLESETTFDLSVLGIDAMAGCFKGPDGWRVVGQGTVTLYLNGVPQTFESGQQVPIPVSE